MTTVQQWEDRRSDELRDPILDAAARDFNEKGFERSTTKEVVPERGVSEGTIPNSFASNRVLLLSLGRRFAGAASGLFHDRLSGELRVPACEAVRYGVIAPQRRPA